MKGLKIRTVTGAEFEVIAALAESGERAQWNVMLGYLYGVIRGKQLEPARRKGGVA